MALVGVIAAPAAGRGDDEDGAQSAERSAEPQTPEEIREQRHYRSEPSARRILEIPRIVLELPWYPVASFLNYSERTDLFRRIEDLFYFNEERTIGWFPKIEVGGELGSGGGASLFHNDAFDRGHQADVSFLYASRDGYEVRAAYAIPGAAAGGFELGFEAGALRDPDVEIFARADASGRPTLGVDTEETDETQYSFRGFDGRLRAGRRFADALEVTAHVRGEVVETDLRDDSSPLLGQLPGIGEDIGFVGGGLRLAVDRRDHAVRPFSGWLVQSELDLLAAADETSQGQRFGHYRYAFDAELVVPIYRPHRVLDVRVHLERVERLGGRQIAFYHLPVLDLNHGLRSYPRNRFRDRGILLSSVEYRYPIWKTWDAFLFVDGGQTFDDYSDIDSDALRYSGGGGIRFMSANRLLFLFQVGAGSEGTEVGLDLGKVF